MPDLSKHLRTAARQLRRNPGFSLTAILTLAVGIGATTAIFSIFYAVLLRPLPYVDAGRLVSLTPLSVTPGQAPNENELSYPNFRDWRDRARSFESMASFHPNSIVLNAAGSNGARNLAIGVVSSDFFHVLGIAPMLGRSFNRNEEKAGARVVILSNELWASAFHSSPGVLGTSVKLSDELYTVVGVLPAGVTFPFVAPVPIEVWTTPAVDAVGENPSTEQRGWTQINAIARLRPNVGMEQAKAELTGILGQLAAQYPESNANETAVLVRPTLDVLVGNVRKALHILLIAVGALLLIACANVAGLLLARGASRQAELAVRSALGATRAEITLQLFTESVLLSLLGGAGGVLIAMAVLKAILIFIPKNLPRLDTIAVNGPVLVFAIGVSLLTGILFGLLPARRLSRLDPATALRDGTRTSTSGRSQNTLHAALVVGETALGLVLLVGAGLLIRSFLHMLNVDPGFNPQHVLTFRIGTTEKSYPDEKRIQFYERVLARMQALPGVQATTAAYPLPFNGNMGISFEIEGHPTDNRHQPEARTSLVYPGFFETLQIALKKGRLLKAEDNRADTPPVVVINEALAQQFFPGEDVLGKRISTGLDEKDVKSPRHWREIVGVVGNVKRNGITEDAHPEYYVPYAQAAVAMPQVAMRVTGDPAAYTQAVTRAVAEMDKEVPVYRVRSMAEGVAAASAQPRFQALLLTAFAGVALLLAAISLYAVLSYMVSQRTHELGLRLALGAQRGNILGLVMQRGLRLTLVGLALGTGVSVLLTRFVTVLLYRVDALDPVTFIVVAAVLLVVSALASLLPSARAARLEPMHTLRNQ